MKRIFLVLILISVISATAFSAVFGKIEVQCPDNTYKIYVDDKFAGTGTVIVKVNPGIHKIKVLEKGKMVLLTNKEVAANQYLAMKGTPPPVVVTAPATEEEEAMPEYLMTSTPESLAIVTAETAPQPVKEPEPADQSRPAENKADEYSMHYYISPAFRSEDDYAAGCAGLSAGLEFGWGGPLFYDVSLSTFSGDNKNAVLSEGTIGVSGLDLGLIYKMGGFYFGTGTGYYAFTHNVADSVLKAKEALFLDYEETIDGNFGFYCKGGWRFALWGMDMDLGVKGTIVNTVAKSTETNTVTHVETENQLDYGFPMNIVYLGIIF